MAQRFSARRGDNSDKWGQLFKGQSWGRNAARNARERAMAEKYLFFRVAADT